MNIERALLITFLGNYLTNTVVAALVALIPASATPGVLTPQYLSYVALAAVTVGVLTWWYMRSVRAASGLTAGVVFGVTGAVVALLTAFVSGIAGVLGQTGSLSQALSIIPNFIPFLASVSTIVLIGIWIIPAVVIGYFLGRSPSSASAL